MAAVDVLDSRAIHQRVVWNLSLDLSGRRDQSPLTDELKETDVLCELQNVYNEIQTLLNR